MPNILVKPSLHITKEEEESSTSASYWEGSGTFVMVSLIIAFLENLYFATSENLLHSLSILVLIPGSAANPHKFGPNA